MTIPLNALPPFDEDGNLCVVVESPRGSSLKLEYVPRKRIFSISRALPIGVTYPYDWGFIPGTLAPDGDPLDAMVLHSAATYPGVLLPCRILGVVMMSQIQKGKREENHRVIAVPTWNNRLEDVDDAARLPKRMRRELEQFFLTATFFTGKNVQIEGWGGPLRARAVVNRSIASEIGGSLRE